MKRLICVLSLFAGACALWADRLYVEDITVKQGEKAELNICYEFDAESQYSGYQLELHLPQGIKTVTDSEGVSAYTAGECQDETFIISNNDDAENDVVIFVAFSLLNHPLSGTSGVLLTLPIEVDEKLDIGSFTGTLSNIQMSCTDGVTTVELDEASFSISCPGEDEPNDEPGDAPSDDPDDNPNDEQGDDPSDDPDDNPNDEPGDDPNDDPTPSAVERLVDRTDDGEWYSLDGTKQNGKPARTGVYVHGKRKVVVK